MWNALEFRLKSKVFNNVERTLKAQPSIQAQRMSTVLGKLKVQLVLSSDCGGCVSLCVMKMQTQRRACGSRDAVMIW